MTMLYILDLIGTAVFAISGALAAKQKHIDVYGVIVFGLVTAIGGGTFRDMLLSRTPVFWIGDNNYIYVAVASSLLTFVVARYVSIPRRTLIVADACGLALFTIIGADVALGMNTSALVAIMMGIVTGTGGGMVRDILAARTPLVLQKEIYATASLAGAIIYVIWPGEQLSTTISIVVIIGLRLSTIKLKQSLPLFDE